MGGGSRGGEVFGVGGELRGGVVGRGELPVCFPVDLHLGGKESEGYSAEADEAFAGAAGVVAEKEAIIDAKVPGSEGVAFLKTSIVGRFAANDGELAG